VFSFFTGLLLYTLDAINILITDKPPYTARANERLRLSMTSCSVSVLFPAASQSGSDATAEGDTSIQIIVIFYFIL